MTIRTENQFFKTLSDYLFSSFDGPDRTLKIALILSLMLHATLFIPAHLFKSHKRPIPNENLVEIALVRNKQKSKAAVKKPAKPALKPTVKHKRALKIKKKSTPQKKSKRVTKESTLARRSTRPKKESTPTKTKLDEIKNRLNRQREEEKLNSIRQRIRDNSSPAARAQQASMTQIYNRTLTAWIMRNWHLPEHLLNSGLEATISLTIAASGALLKHNEEQLSGNTIFDHAMRQAIANATPFPPFPAELMIPQEEFVITFNPNNINREN